MDPDPGSSIPFFLLVLLLLHALFAAAEIAMVSIRKSDLARLAEDERRGAHLIINLTQDTPRLIATIQLALKLTSLLVFGLLLLYYRAPAVNYLSQLRPDWSPVVVEVTFTVLLAFLLALFLLVFAEFIPKSIAARHPAAIAYIALYPVAILSLVASPLVTLSIAAGRLVSDGQDEVDGSSNGLVTEEQIKTLVDAGEEGGFIEEDEREMIYSIFELGDTLAREVMVPRVDVIAIDVDRPIADALAVIVEGGHSRIPVYQDTVDNIVGMLYAKDLLGHWPDFADLALKDILREVYYVPETKPVDKLLQELQQLKVHIAVVVDEYGGVAGLVTIEDILEEIVGEIQDEYDSEEDVMEVVGQNEVIFNSRADLDDVNYELGIDLPTDSSDTVGGLMYSSLGRVPVVGDTVRFEDAELTVLSVIGRRMEKIRVRCLEPRASLGPRHDGANASSPDTEQADLKAEVPADID